MKNTPKNFKWVFCKDFISFCNLKFSTTINLEYFSLIEMLRLHRRENAVNHVHVFYCGNPFAASMEKLTLTTVLPNASTSFFNLYVFESITIPPPEKNPWKLINIISYSFFFTISVMWKWPPKESVRASARERWTQCVERMGIHTTTSAWPSASKLKFNNCMLTRNTTSYRVLGMLHVMLYTLEIDQFFWGYFQINFFKLSFFAIY